MISHPIEQSSTTLSSAGPVVLPPAQSDAPSEPLAAAEAHHAIERPATTLVWGTPFARVDMGQTLQLAQRIIENRRPEYFITANLNYLMLTDQFPRLQQINESAAAVIADGHPIVRRSRLGSTPLPERVAGSDMIVELAGLAQQNGYSIYLLGAAPGVGQAAAGALVARFPGLKIAGVESPPFRQLNAAEHDAMICRIRDAKPSILLVAFGQPKGECWIYDNLTQLGVPLSIQLGASFDFLAGTVQRAPKFWQRIGCEWLYRACSDPRRLGPRYARNILFLIKLLALDCGLGRPRSARVEEPAN